MPSSSGSSSSPSSPKEDGDPRGGDPGGDPRCGSSWGEKRTKKENNKTRKCCDSRKAAARSEIAVGLPEFTNKDLSDFA